MSEQREKTHPLHENLDTAYVNLGALVRYLRAREFAGRVHVELDEYDADVFLTGKDEPRVVERDHATGRAEEGEAAFYRLLVRAREAGGLISVYEAGESRAGGGDVVRMRREASAEAAGRSNAKQESGAAQRATAATGGTAAGADATAGETEAEAERRALLHLSGELVAAVERAASVAGGDFASAFYRARIGLADDFPFLDPMQRRFNYREGAIELHGKTSTGMYVAGVCEALRRTVEHMATEGEKIGVRRDVARELSTLARRRQTALAHFKFTSHLERIAGMRLL